jgi:ribonuclease P protein component
MVRSFPKARRLRRRPEFQRVYDQGWKTHGRFMTLFVLPNRLECSRLGVSATRKIGGAVDRNRAKRRIREVFRSSTIPSGVDLVVVPRHGAIDAPWDELMGDFRMLLSRQRRPPGGRRGD